MDNVKRRKPQAPRTLSTAGVKVFKSIANRFSLRPDEYVRLESAAKVADTLDLLESQWIERGSPMVTKGSMGQEVIHPLIGEMRTQRMALDRILAGLKLPDEVEEGQDAPNQHRQAAQARWATRASRGA